MRIAFAGNPNSGKTTMYNALTGRSEKVGNWSILAWTIPWAEEPGGLQSTGSQRVRQD